MTTAQLTWTLGLLTVIGLLIYYASIYNGVQRLVNLITKVASNTSVLMKKRTGFILKLITIVGFYGLHERGIDVKVAEELGGATDNNKSRGVIERLASLRMTFPELKADSLMKPDVRTGTGGNRHRQLARELQLNSLSLQYRTFPISH